MFFPASHPPEDPPTLPARASESAAAGFTLAELLITMALSALILVLSLKMVSGLQARDTKQYKRMAGDFVHHLAAACEVVKYRYGAGPIAAQTVDGSGNPTAAFADGWTTFLPGWESTTPTLTTAPTVLNYPQDMLLYLKPYEATVPDPSNQIPNTPTAIMSGVTDGTWVLLDMNGTDTPNSIAATGDRVLLNIDDTTCQVKTAAKLCTERSCTEAYGNSFYD
ncbi:MAG: type II secretion system protein J [Candidatus Melainabacteria bacterium]